MAGACRTDAGGRIVASPSGIEWSACSLASSLAEWLICSTNSQQDGGGGRAEHILGDLR